MPSSDPTPKIIWTRPVANPRYSRGTERMIAVWLGVLKKPWPIPVQASSSAGRLQCESTFSTTPIAKPTMITDSPIDAGIIGPIRSVSSPASAARLIVNTGAERNRSQMTDGGRAPARSHAPAARPHRRQDDPRDAEGNEEEEDPAPVQQVDHQPAERRAEQQAAVKGHRHEPVGPALGALRHRLHGQHARRG